MEIQGRVRDPRPSFLGEVGFARDERQGDGSSRGRGGYGGGGLGGPRSNAIWTLHPFDPRHTRKPHLPLLRLPLPPYRLLCPFPFPLLRLFPLVPPSHTPPPLLGATESSSEAVNGSGRDRDSGSVRGRGGHWGVSRGADTPRGGHLRGPSAGVSALRDAARSSPAASCPPGLAVLVEAHGAGPACAHLHLCLPPCHGKP